MKRALNLPFNPIVQQIGLGVTAGIWTGYMESAGTTIFTRFRQVLYSFRHGGMPCALYL